MKKILVFLLVLLSFISSYSITYNTVQSGLWSNNSTWDANGIAPLTGNNTTIYINVGDTIILNDTITFNNNCSLYIFGKLIINGDFQINNNLYIEVTGELEINGAFVANNNADVTITNTGVTNISGNATFHNGADITLNGNLNVGGNLSGGSSNEIIGTGNLTVYGGLSGFDSSSFTGVINSSVPIELIDFNCNKINKLIYIKWTTLTETNNDYFIIEKSYNLVKFEELSTIDGQGNSNYKIDYNFVYEDSYNGNIYYRLKQVDFDGKYTYSNIISLQNSSNFNITFLNNTIIINSIDKVKIEICDISGRIVFNDYAKDLKLNLNKNIYIINIYKNNILIYKNKKILLN
jgi:hypothetical protein